MSVKTKIISGAEIVKTTVLNSQLDDTIKENLITFINNAVTATNGISQEEKIQSLTESMASLATNIATFMCKTKGKLDEIESRVDEIQPTDKLDQIKLFEQKLSEAENYRKINGIAANISISDDNIKSIVKGIKNTGNIESTENLTYRDKIINIFKAPWPWIFGMFLVFSPHFNDLLHALQQYFAK